MAEYLIQDTTLTEIAEAIRSKTGSTDSLTPSQMVEAVTGLKSLPALSNPVTADIIPNGYEAVDGAGNLLSGTGAGLGDATVADVLTGKTFTSANGLKLTGTLVQKDFVTGSAKRLSSTSYYKMNITNISSYNNFVIYSVGGSSSGAWVPLVKKTNGVMTGYEFKLSGGSGITTQAFTPTVSGNQISIGNTREFADTTYYYVLWN